MGVIHKLREDVVSFIVDQKKKNPAVSVRQLAVQTSEKFQVKISKSSVNTTLKNASLSSSVGRRTINTTRAGKFSIPLSTKTEISRRMKKVGFAQDKDIAVEKEKSGSKEISQEKVGTQRHIDKTKVQQKEVPKDKAPPLMADSPAEKKPLSSTAKKTEDAVIGSVMQDQDFGKHVQQLRSQKNNQKAQCLKGAGFIFLKAAQWEVLSGPLLSKLLKKYFSGASSGPFDAAGELFLFLRSLGAETFDQALNYRQHGVWLLNHFCGVIPEEKEVKEKLKELFRWEKAVEDSCASSIVMEYDFEKKHVFSETAAFKLFLENGTELILNAAMSSFSVGSKEAVSSCATFPIEKSMTWLSNYLISNNQSLVFHVVPGEKKFDKIFYDIIAVFENLSGRKFLKAAVLSKDNEALAEFSAIPTLKRSFLIGVSPGQREFDVLTKSAKWVEKTPFYHQGTDSTVYFTETRTDCIAAQFKEKVNDFRVVTIWKNIEGDPCWAILTNSEKEDGRKIVETYISRWPYFDDNEQENPGIRGAEINTIQKSGNIEFSDIFSDFTEMLKRHCQKHFFQQNGPDFDVNYFNTDIYDISGSIYEAEDFVTVQLDVPTSSENCSDIEYAVKRVNERHISDYFGRKLWLEV